MNLYTLFLLDLFICKLRKKYYINLYFFLWMDMGLRFFEWIWDMGLRWPLAFNITFLCNLILVIIVTLEKYATWFLTCINRKYQFSLHGDEEKKSVLLINITIFVSSQYTIFKDVISKKLVLVTEVHLKQYSITLSEFFACVARSNTNVHDHPTIQHSVTNKRSEYL